MTNLFLPVAEGDKILIGDEITVSIKYKKTGKRATILISCPEDIRIQKIYETTNDN